MRDSKESQRKKYRRVGQKESLDEKLKAAASKGLLILPTRLFRPNGFPIKLAGRPLSEILQEIRG